MVRISSINYFIALSVLSLSLLVGGPSYSQEGATSQEPLTAASDAQSVSSEAANNSDIVSQEASEQETIPAPPVEVAAVAVPTPVSTFSPKFSPAPEFDMGGSILKMVKGLALCIAVLLVLVWIQKRALRGRLGNPAKRSLQIIERLPTGPKTQVLLISVKGREYLVGQGSDSVNIYGEVVHEELEEEGVPVSGEKAK